MTRKLSVSSKKAGWPNQVIFSLLVPIGFIALVDFPAFSGIISRQALFVYTFILDTRELSIF